jgi:hypothetical protein
MDADRRIGSLDDPTIVALVVKSDDHEVRMRSLEKFRWMATGALVFVAVSFPTTVAAVVAVLTAS